MPNKTDQKFKYGVSHSLQETADMLGMSRERVRQIEKRALEKIRRALMTRYGITSLASMLG